MRRYLGIGALAVLPLALAAVGAAQPTARLRPEANRAFDAYASGVEASLKSRLEERGPLKWLDATGEERASAVSGEILTHQIDTGSVDVPGGMIHDWIGVAYIPDATASDTVAFLQDVDRHKDYYAEVLESRLLGKDGNTVRSFLRLRKKKVLTVVLNAEHEALYRELGDGQWYMSSRSTRIAEVKNAGSPTERELPEGEDGGFLWRLNAYWRIEETGDGTWVELRTVSLSRSVPFAVGWLVRPFLNSVPRESLASTLRGTRNAVEQ